MSYVDELAGEIRSSVTPELVPAGDTGPLFRMYAVLALAKGEGVGVEDVHDAWVAWMSGTDPHHRSLIPFSELSLDVQCADRPYVDAIRAVAREHGLGR